MVGGGRWRLARGVGLLEGTVVGDSEAAGQHAYTVVLPSGHRYQVGESLYRLAELLAGGLAPEEVAAQLSQRLRRPFTADEVDRLVESKLVARGLVTPG